MGVWLRDEAALEAMCERRNNLIGEKNKRINNNRPIQELEQMELRITEISIAISLLRRDYSKEQYVNYGGFR